MAALQGQPQPQVLAPAPTPIVSFCTHVFCGQSKYPEAGQCAHLLKPFLIDVNNAGNNAAPFSLCNQITFKVSNLEPIAFAMLYNAIAKIYLCPQRLDQPSGQQPHVHYKKFYVFDGDLLNNDDYHAILPNDFYDLIPNNILVPTVQTILAALAGNPGLSDMGPYQASDANTESV